VAHHLTEYLKRNGRLDKTIVFCVDQEHALQMRNELARLNRDLMRVYPDYVARVVSDEGRYGRGAPGQFPGPGEGVAGHRHQFADADDRRGRPDLFATSSCSGRSAPSSTSSRSSAAARV
jgi:hypothetical protein